jgi:hypothetical protein
VINIHSGPGLTDPIIATHTVTVPGPVLAQVTAFANDVKTQLDAWTGSPPGTWQATVVNTGLPQMGYIVVFESPQQANTMPWSNPSLPAFYVSSGGFFYGPTVLPNGFLVQSCEQGEGCNPGNTKLVFTLSQVGAGNKLHILPAGFGLGCTDGISTTPTFTIGPNLYDAAMQFLQVYQKLVPFVVGFALPSHQDSLLNYESTSGQPIQFELYLDLPFCPVDFIACDRDQGTQSFSPPSDFAISRTECCGSEPPCTPCFPYDFAYLLAAF